MNNKDCETCTGKKECVNIGEFKVNDCLAYEMSIEAMNEEIEALNDK
jgi:hypothetical protein